MPYKPLKVLLTDYSEFYNQLKSISRYGYIDDFILPDYKTNQFGVRVRIYTKNHCYSIKAIKPGERDPLGFKDKKDDGYLGCVAQTRKPRAGEDWTRGNDLADGDYSEKTWREIVNDIIGCELVKVVKQPREKNLDK